MLGAEHARQLSDPAGVAPVDAISAEGVDRRSSGV
jgi:hypothetical protein